MIAEEDAIAKLTAYFAKERRNDIIYCYGEEAIKEDEIWIKEEVVFWYNHIKNIDPKLTEEQRYRITRKFLHYRFGEEYYERPLRKGRAMLHPRFNPPPSAREALAKLKEINEKNLVNERVRKHEDEATYAAEEYLIELINKEKSRK